MSDHARRAEIEAAEAYEALFVPALFTQWAPRLTDAAGIQHGERVLDVACGTGVLAREAAACVGPAGSVAGVDASRGMLAVAERLAPHIEWRHGTAESLPFPDASFDAVVSQFGLMFFTDRERALREMARVLRPGGRLAIAVWGSLEDIDAYRIEAELLDRLAGARAGDAVRAPFALGDVDVLGKLFSAAGFASPEITTHHGTALFPSVRIMVEADLRGWLPVMGVHLNEPQIEAILQEADRALGQYIAPDGRVTFDVLAHIVTG